MAELFIGNNKEQHVKWKLILFLYRGCMWDMLFILKQSPDEKMRSLLSFDNPTKLIEGIKF